MGTPTRTSKLTCLSVFSMFYPQLWHAPFLIGQLKNGRMSVGVLTSFPLYLALERKVLYAPDLNHHSNVQEMQKYEQLLSIPGAPSGFGGSRLLFWPGNCKCLTPRVWRWNLQRMASFFVCGANFWFHYQKSIHKRKRLLQCFLIYILRKNHPSKSHVPSKPNIFTCAQQIK